MPFSPATPEKGPLGPPSGAASRVVAESAKLKHRGYLVDPSPASTYGETATGESVPATPLEAAVHAPKITVARAAIPINFTPLLRTGTQDADNPMTGDVANVSQSAGNELGSGSDKSKHPDDSGADQHENMATRTPERLHQNGSGDGSGRKSTPTSNRASGLESPMSPAGHLGTESAVTAFRGGSTRAFVLHDAESRENDPFVSPGQGPSMRRGAESLSVNGYATPSQHTSETSPSARSRERREREIREDTDGRPSPRPDRSGQVISAENAQAVLPPSACVFVANLASIRTDDELQKSVETAFQEYGTVYVKIRRDSRGMPYAFCQYITDEDARRAIVQGRRRLIDGRPCRTEPARVNRSVYVSRIAGGPVSEAEARHELSPYGQIDSCWHSSNTEREMYQLPDGIWVKFAFFQDCRDAQSAFRNHEQFRLEQPPSAVDAPHRIPNVRGYALRAPPPVRPRFSRLPPALPRAATASIPIVDRRSILIGNLPENVTREKIAQACGEYGNVISVEIVLRPSLLRSSVLVFAFVEFAQEDQASQAICHMNQKIFEGRVIRVEAKESSETAAQPMLANDGNQAQGSIHHVNADRATSGSHIQPQIHQGAQSAATGTERVFLPPTLFPNPYPEFMPPPHVAVPTTGTAPGMQMPQYPGYGQFHSGTEQARGPAPGQAFGPPEFPHPGYHQAMPVPGMDVFGPYHQYAQYAQYWPMGYYPYQMHYPTAPGNLASAAVPNAPVEIQPEGQAINNSAAASGQEAEV